MMQHGVIKSSGISTMNENLFNEQFEQFWKKAKTRLFDVDANDQEDIK